MNVLTKLGLFGVALVVLFSAGLGAGRVTSPVSAESAAGHTTGSDGDGHGASADDDGAPAKGEFSKGVLVSDRGYRFEPRTTVLQPGERTGFRFSILGPDGDPVRHYVPTHEKKLHLIVARRDLTGFWHVHPTLDADGTWQIPLSLPEPGSYRAYADFQPKGEAEPLTLGVDLAVPGRFVPQPLPASSPIATVDGYQVRLDGDLVAGRANPVTLRVSKDGRPVTDLEPYLGASGHLVALRAGDLAYLHVHPTHEAGGGPEIGFGVEVPSTGRYRLFLDFQHDGVVRTAAFTVEVGPGAAPQPEPSGPVGHDGHGD